MTRRQMAHRVDAPRRRLPLAALAAAALVVVVGLLGAMVIRGGRGPEPSQAAPPSATPAPSLAAHPSPTPMGTAQKSVAPGTPPTATDEPSEPPIGTPTPTPTPLSSPTPAPSGAPQSAANFDLQGQVIDIGFPLRADTEYHYRNNWLERRDGPPDPYNHAKVGPDGQLIRLHDGIDIFAPEGEPVLSPFDGVVIDPATKWTPWVPDRYGLTVAIQSQEPTSAGYYAILVHLDKIWVDIGQHVSRGEVIGVLGRTGNAENVQPQLHFELRAPFLIDWLPIGEDRKVDAFNPYPSLVAADPKS